MIICNENAIPRGIAFFLLFSRSKKCYNSCHEVSACKADGVLMAIPVISQADFACDIKYNNGYYRKQNRKAMEEEKLEQ